MEQSAVKIIIIHYNSCKIAGDTAYIFKTEYNGKCVYVISLDEELSCELKVAQPDVRSDLETRIEALEKEVYKNSKSENKEI